MTYYPTIEEDLTRAKEILAKGKVRPDDKPEWMTDHHWEQITTGAHDGGAIYGADTYAAYKLLESFVDQVESYQLLLATMGVTNYKDAILMWAMVRERLHHEGMEHTECQEALIKAQAMVKELRLQNHRLIQERERKKEK